VWSLPVVIFHSGRDFDAGMREAEEQCLVEKLVAHPAVKALAEAVLHRPARRDVMPLHADLSTPCEHSVAGEFRAIIADYHPGLAALGDQPG